VILLVLALAGWTYLVIRTLRSRQAQATLVSSSPAAPDAPPEAWGHLDDMQLTRLLRHAARDE
jgi:hypothetical protein